MAKMFKKTFAMLMVLCMLVGMLPVQALAEEAEVVAPEATVTLDITSETPTVVVNFTPGEDDPIVPEIESELTTGDGIVAEGEYTMTETTDEEGNSVVIEEVTITTEGKLEDGTAVEGEETYVETTTTTTTETETVSTVKSTLEGQETTTLENGAITPDDTDLPEVEVPVVPDDAELDGSEEPDVKVEVKENEETGESVTIETTTSISGEKITTETSETIKVNVNVTEVTKEVTGDVKEGEDDAEYDYTESETTIVRDVTTEAGNVDVTVNEGDSTDLEAVAPEDYEGKDYDNAEGLLKGLTPNDLGQYADPVEKPDEAGYDYQWRGYAEATNAVRAVAIEVTYKKDPVTGEPLKDDNGEFIIEKTQFSGKYNDGMDSTPSIFALTKMNENGEPEYYYGYCIDTDTEAVPGSWYKVSNLEDSNYYPDEESAEKLRAIVTNGYWGKKEGQGSVAQMMEKLLAYYGEEATIEVDDKNGNMITKNVREVLAGMDEADALAVTQAAIWSYANGTLGVQDGNDGKIIDGIYSVVKPKANLANTDRDYDYDRDARLKAMYQWMLSLEGISQDEENVSTIINENNFVDDMSITIKDKAEEHEENYDANADNDVYNTELNFKLAFVPAENDDLLVYLMDEEGNKIVDKDGNFIVRRLAGENSEGREADTILPDAYGVYTLTGLQLSENQNFKFDLRLDGTQYLQRGVYVYTAHGGATASQTMVGMAEGTHTVNVSASMTIKFEVDESKSVVATRHWRTESDPRFEEVQEPQDPPTRYRYTPGTVIEEEPVPLAEVPQTGDNSVIWFAMIMLAAAGLFVLNQSEKKCKA